MTENEIMLTSVLDCRRVDLAVNTRVLTPDQQARYDQMQARRNHGEPLQYIVGQWDFYGMTLFVDRRALIPRPETEILVDLAIHTVKSDPRKETLKALDLGIGSGNMTAALLKNLPHMTMTALDISDEALDLARQNAKHHGVESRVNFLCDDMARYLKEAVVKGEKFDMVVSNPPYIPTQQLGKLPIDVQQEPRIALDGGDDGLRFCRAIIEYAWQILQEKGFLAMEIGDGQRDDIAGIFAQYPQYREIRFFKDYVGTDRVVMARKRVGA
ncbi:MAG: peptide chain release factor N(5)-glutamine methyltransferase [Candidatus Omnitrophica bacterium]|nr:peptide chain release factor N(5)-glutamine methyltransferase [Candidatus Omnitrophota bacterium]